MSWIKAILPEEAHGSLREQYDAAIARAGKVYQVVQVMSLNADVMRASIDLYVALMKGPSGLTRRQRELIATAVSALNRCVY